MHRTTRATAVAAWIATAALALAGAPAAWATPAWLAQPDLTASGDNASPPTVAMNAAGDAVAAWQRSSGPNLLAQASVRPAGTSFSAPLTLGSAGLAPLGTPQAAIDGAGNAIVVWQQPEGLTANTVVVAAIRPAGGAFGTPVALSASGTVSVHPQLATNPAGDAVVVWEHLAGGTAAVQAAVRPAGGGFSAPLDVSAAGSAGPAPQVALDDAGNATAVWTQTAVAGSTVQAATRPAGGAFTAPVDLSSADGDASSAQVATNGAGRVAAVWEYVDPPTNRTVQAAIKPAGGAFAAPEDLSLFGADAISPQVAVDAADDVYAVWARFDGATRVIQLATRLGGVPFFGIPGTLSAAGGEAREPQVALDGAGDAVVAWQRSDGANTIVQAIARRAGAGFGAVADLSLTGRDAVAPRIAIDGDGDAVAAWQRSDGTNTIVQAAGHDTAGPQLRGLSVPAAASAGIAASYSVSPLDVWSAVGATLWSFDDGAIAVGTSVSHAFDTVGDHAVSATTTDALGNTSSVTRVVPVGAAPPPGSPPAGTPPPPPPPPPCTGCGVRLTKLNVAIGFGAHVTKRYTVFTKLVVQPAIAGTTISVRCSGRGCPFHSTKRTVKKSARRLDLTSLVRRARLRRGAQLSVRVTKPNTIGAAATIGVRDRKRPRRVVRCLFAGDPVPAPCPS